MKRPDTDTRRDEHIPRQTIPDEQTHLEQPEEALSEGRAETQPETVEPALSPDASHETFGANGERAASMREQAQAPVVTREVAQSERESPALEEGQSLLEVEAYAEDVQPSGQGFTFKRPSREQVIAWAPFLGLVLLGAILRFWNLGDKPLHHDESLHAYYSLMLMHNMENWLSCFSPTSSCYHYDPLLHGPFQFHAIALVYKICQLLGFSDNGVNTTTVRIAAATLGTVIVGLPFFIRDYLGKYGALLASFLLAISPSLVYFSRFAREDIYMACFTMLLVVSMARYCRDRSLKWLITGSVAFALSYATKEATFLTVAILGSFFVALVVWDIAVRFPFAQDIPEGAPGAAKFLPRTWAPLALLILAVVVAPVALAFFHYMHTLSLYINDPKTQPLANNFVANLKNITVAIVPWLGIALGIYVLVILMLEYFEKLPINDGRRRGLAKRVDPVRQPLLNVVTTMPWMHWVFAILCGWAVFLILFTVLFTNIRGGIGDGIWQGLYYWLQQQQVARGEQPWYYYFMLIPLYEQIGLVFGIVGVIRCLRRPSRFRLFLVYWFIGSVFIYSWAGEKMPWLMIHMTMPMMLLAALGLQPAVVAVVEWARQHLNARASAPVGAPVASRPASSGRPFGSIAVLVLALLLLVPTLQNMFQVTYVHAADGPHEMMVYVQTTFDVNKVMAKVDAVDNKLYHGEKKLPVSVVSDATWPFAWYLRDYHQTTFLNIDAQNVCPPLSTNAPVVIVGGDCLATYKALYKNQYVVSTYHMRTWWDEGYKPAPCVPTNTTSCAGQPTWGGVGPLLWLSYGDTPPAHAQFNLGSAASHVWNWWWHRQAIGSTDGSYDMAILVRKDLAS